MLEHVSPYPLCGPGAARSEAYHALVPVLAKQLVQPIVMVAAIKFGLLDEACAQVDKLGGDAASQLGITFPAFGVGSVLSHGEA